MAPPPPSAPAAAAVVAAVVAAFLLASLLQARARRARAAAAAAATAAAEEFAPPPSAPPAAAALQALLNAPPDVPDADVGGEDRVTLYAGGASTPAVVLQVARLALPLSVARVARGSEVAFHGAGAFLVAATGALVHDGFQLSAGAGDGSTFAFEGPVALRAMLSRRDVQARPSRSWGLTLLDAARVTRAHDLARLSAAAAVVPEVCKAANLQAVTLAFYAARGAAAGVTFLVMPRAARRDPVAVGVRFVGDDLEVTYVRLEGAAAQPAAAVLKDAEHLAGHLSSLRGGDAALGSALARSGSSIAVLRGARSGTLPVAVAAELVRGRLRVVTDEGGRRAGYLATAPFMLQDAETLRSHPLTPPSVLVRSRAAEDVVALPFSVGDLRPLLRL